MATGGAEAEEEESVAAEEGQNQQCTGIGIVQISAYSQVSAGLPTPEAFGPYSKQTGGSAGVLSLIDSYEK